MTNRNVIWGSRILDHYSIGSILGETPHLRREPNSGAFLGILDADKLLANALTFPVTRRCLVRSSIDLLVGYFFVFVLTESGVFCGYITAES